MVQASVVLTRDSVYTCLCTRKLWNMSDGSESDSSSGSIDVALRRRGQMTSKELERCIACAPQNAQELVQALTPMWRLFVFTYYESMRLNVSVEGASLQDQETCIQKVLDISELRSNSGLGTDWGCAKARRIIRSMKKFARPLTITESFANKRRTTRRPWDVPIRPRKVSSNTRRVHTAKSSTADEEGATEYIGAASSSPVTAKCIDKAISAPVEPSNPVVQDVVESAKNECAPEPEPVRVENKVVVKDIKSFSEVPVCPKSSSAARLMFGTT